MQIHIINLVIFLISYVGIIRIVSESGLAFEKDPNLSEIPIKEWKDFNHSENAKKDVIIS